MIIHCVVPPVSSPVKSRRIHFSCCMENWAADFDLQGFVITAAKPGLEPQESYLQVALLQPEDSLSLCRYVLQCKQYCLLHGVEISHCHSSYSISTMNSDSKLLMELMECLVLLLGGALRTLPWQGKLSVHA